MPPYATTIICSSSDLIEQIVPEHDFKYAK